MKVHTLYNSCEGADRVILYVKNIYTAQKIIGISAHFRRLNGDIKMCSSRKMIELHGHMNKWVTLMADACMHGKPSRMSTL